MLSIIMAGLSLFGYREYRQKNDLVKTNQSLQKQITSLKQENEALQERINRQSLPPNDDSAKIVATQFVKIFNDSSITGNERSAKLQKLMTKEAFNKKIGSSLNEQPVVTTVESRVEIKGISSTNIGTSEKVTIDYDYVQQGKENYVQRMKIVLDMVIPNGKWLISNYEITYIDGPEGKGV